MKMLFDLFPVILFFGTFKYAEKHADLAAHWVGTLLGATQVAAAQAPILLATVVVIVATIAQILWVKVRHGKIDRMLWISLVLVVVFGGLTLFFQNETFIKWKPTLLYWIFAVSLAFSVFVLRKNPLQAMLGEQLNLPPPVWNRMTWSWFAFFVFMGVLNLVVAFNFPTDVWVNFKLFGGMGLLFAFVLVQGLMLSKYVEDKS